MKKVYTTILCLVLLSISYHTFAQETATPTQEQPLEKPIVLKEPPIEQDPKQINKNPPVTAFAGGIPTGQTPTPSPESKLINRFQDIPVNLFLGTPIIGLPIYTLSESGGTSVPIALSYNATGMKAHDVASWCGMNWSMNFPQINRIVRGLPDEGKFSLNNDFSVNARKGFYQYGIKAENDVENDAQPDLFMLVINGASYKFSFDVNKKAHFYPEADIDVQVTWTARKDENQNPTTVGYFSNWIVTMPDGSKYYFDGASAYESSFEQEAQEAKNISNYNAGLYLNAEEVVSAFYVTKIETAFGHQTNFEYHSTFYSFSRIAEQEAITNNCTFTNIDKKINRVFVISSTLFKISNGTHVVEFNKGGWSQTPDVFGRPSWYLNNTYPARKDIDYFSQNTRDSSNARALHKISVYAKDDPTKIYEWKFKYDYTFGADQSSTPLGYSYSVIGNTHKWRFKLRSIEEPDGNKYTFKYYDDGFFLMPSRLTQGVDHWGYLNGVLGATLMIGKDDYRNCANGQYSDRTARVTWSQYGTLTAISHSTGGSTLLDYENNTARNYTGLIGGSRIRKITFIDSIANLKTIKRYDYKQANGQSSGFLSLNPVYHFDDATDYAGSPNQFWHSGLYQQILSESSRPAVGYSRVKETILSSDETDSLGYTISEFLQPLQQLSVKAVIYYNCTDPNNYNTCDSLIRIRPYRWHPYVENSVGVPARVAVYGKNNQLLSEKSSAYTEAQLQVGNRFQGAYHAFRWVGQNYTFDNQSFYYEFFNTYRITSDTTKTYSQDGTNPLVSINNYEYATQAKHNQLIKTTTKDSYGNTLEQSFKYAPDFIFGVLPPFNEDGQAIRVLQFKHIYNVPIESILRKKSHFGSAFIVGASYQSFYATDSSGRKAGMPKAAYVLENTPRSSMIEATFIDGVNTLVKDSDYDLKSTINAYTSIGLPIQSTIRFGATSKVNYDATYPTLPISQTANLGQASEQTTTTEYAKMLYGISKQTGVNGLSVTNEYYADGKLKQQTDKDGKVLKHIQYVYRGQADSDPLLTTNTTYNRVITRIPRIATTTPLTLTHTDCAILVDYLDGAGRNVQSIAYKASPNQKDLVSGMVEYDKFSRPLKTWLTVESAKADGTLLDTATAKSMAKSFYQDAMPYSEVLEYEASPLSRTFKSYGTGKGWRDSLKYEQAKYETTNAIRLFRLSYDSNVAFYYSSYPTYEIAKTTSIDEKGAKVIEYKDRAGNVVQKDVQVDNSTNYLSTIYIYDEAGRFRYILMPKAVNALPASGTIDLETWSEFNENVQAFHYDGRGRVYESHKPGIGWFRTVYNRLNQAIMSQDDDELAKNNTWNFSQTDGLGRSIRGGQMQLPTAFTRDSLQKLFNAFVDDKQFEERSTASGSVLAYTNRSFPANLRNYINEQNLKNVVYQDDYSWRVNNPYSGQITDYDFQVNPFNSSAYSITNAKGLITGGLHKIDNFGDFWFPSVAYYDDKNRNIQSTNYQDLYARNQSDVQYNFVGETLQARMIYRKNGASDYIRLTENSFDHLGRVTQMYYTLTEGTTTKVPRMKLFNLLYDNIGRIKTKFIQPQANLNASQNSGIWTNTSTWQNNTLPTTNSYVLISKGDTVTIPVNTTVQAATLYDAGRLRFLSNSILQMSALGTTAKPALQSIDYAYDVRGKIKGVNLDASGNIQTSADKLFAYKLDYNFDETIAKQTWKSNVDNQTKSFRFTYDRANRLSSAISGTGEDNFSIPRVSYDANGNITFLSRMAKVANGGSFFTTKIDSLDYQYFNGGNKLKTITDNAPQSALGGFKNGTNSGNDYEYYPDGKLKKDLNRNISLIQYNFLDLVSKIKFVNNDSIQYFYSSTGEKRRTERTIGGQKSFTFYDGERIYTATGTVNSLNDYKLSEIQNPEGRFVNGKLEYGYTDHIGNLRVSYKDSSGVAYITQGYAYDAWGLELKSLRYIANSNLGLDRYSWQGKEDLEADNLEGWSDFGWRIEDRTIGRWFTPDPEDQFESMTTFGYCANNPVSMIDPDGRIVPLLAIGVGALIGGTVNLGIKAYQGRIGSWSDGFAAFGIGALAGGAGALTGGAAFAAVGGGAAGAGGFVAGAIGGVAGSAVSSPIQGFGNAAYFKDPYSAGDFGRDLLIGGVLGGAINGGIAAFKGKSFWSGNSPKTENIAKIKWSIDEIDEVADGSYNVTKSPKLEIGQYRQDLRFWSPKQKIGNFEVFQSDRLFELTDKNIYKMLNGYAPVGVDGKSVALHHALQSDKAALIEVTRTMHEQWSKILHINPNSVGSGINRAAFDIYRSTYWHIRALEIIRTQNLNHIKIP
jgi:RHS repeat-associated protein